MKLVFRPLKDSPSPRPGELHVRPAPDAAPDKAPLSGKVLQQGLAALACGTEPVTQIVVDLRAGFDDLLTAHLAGLLLRRETLPAGYEAFVKFAALGASGRRAGSVPFEQSLEGLCLALRHLAGPDLTDPESAARLTASWEILGRHLHEAASKGVDPRTTPIAAGEPAFAAARAWLAEDRTRYQQDRDRRERWLVRFPDGSAQGTGLLLREPKSELYEFWCQDPAEQSGGQALLFLVVQEGGGKWVMTTRPGQGNSLQALAERLQQAEPDRPWQHDRAAGCSFVASPPQGTKLADKQVQKTVMDWLEATREDSRRLLWPSALAALLLVALGLFLTEPYTRLLQRGAELIWPGDPGHFNNLHVLAIGVSEYQHDAKALRLEFAHDDALSIKDVFQGRPKACFAEVFAPKPLINEHATREAILEALRKLRQKAVENDFVVLFLAGHGDNYGTNKDWFLLPHDFDKNKPGSSRVSWHDIKSELLHDQMRCKCVLVIIDACRSGTATLETPPREETPGRTLVVFSACRSQGVAQESRALKHGALTLAVLEGISGQYHHTGTTKTELPRGNGDGQVSLEDLRHYVVKRVQELTNNQQMVVIGGTGNAALQEIVITRRP
jgi:hypothetical protein